MTFTADGAAVADFFFIYFFTVLRCKIPFLPRLWGWRQTDGQSSLTTSSSIHVANMTMIRPSRKEIWISLDGVLADDDGKNGIVRWGEFFLVCLYRGLCRHLMLEVLFLDTI